MTKRKQQRLQKALAKPKQRFSLRKLSIGTVSVLLGTVFYLGNGGNVHADSNTTSTSPQTPNVSQEDTNATEPSNKVTLHTQPSTDLQSTDQQAQQSTTTDTTKPATTQLQLNSNRGGYNSRFNSITC